MASPVVFALRRQGAVLNAVFHREGTARFARRSLGFVEEVGSIVIHVAVFSTMRILAGVEEHYGMAVVPFMSTGVFSYWIFKSCLVNTATYEVAAPRYRSFSQVTQLDIVLVRGFVNLLLYLTISLGSFLVLRITGYSGPIRNIVYVTALLMLSGIFGMSCGLVCGGIFAALPIVRTLLSGFLRIIMYTSGVFFVIPEMPYKIRPYSLYNPILHLNDLLRQAYFPTYIAEQADLTYVLKWVLCTLVLGMLVERATRRHFDPAHA